jgi:hypothetical protein
MNTNIKLVPLLCLFAASVAGCGVPPDGDESAGELSTAEQAARICDQTGACDGKDPQQAVREMSRELGREMFQGRQGVDEEEVGEVMLKLLSLDRWTVSREERKRICEATRGRFADKVVVEPCINGFQNVRPYGERFRDTEPQGQRCTEGTGNDYFDQCVYVDLNDMYYFDDGPSMKPWQEALTPGRLTSGDHRYVVLFWEAGQKHDYCYHHSPTYGFRRELCDNDFDNQMHQICKNSHKGLFEIPRTSYNRDACTAVAKLMAAAVRHHPEATEAYHNMKTFVRYMEPKELPKPELPDDHTEAAPPVVTCPRAGEVVVGGTCSCPVVSCEPPLRWVDVPDSCGRCEIDTER